MDRGYVRLPSVPRPRLRPPSSPSSNPASFSSCPFPPDPLHAAIPPPTATPKTSLGSSPRCRPACRGRKLAVCAACRRSVTRILPPESRSPPEANDPARSANDSADLEADIIIIRLARSVSPGKNPGPEMLVNYDAAVVELLAGHKAELESLVGGQWKKCEECLEERAAIGKRLAADQAKYKTQHDTLVAELSRLCSELKKADVAFEKEVGSVVTRTLKAATQLGASRPGRKGGRGREEDGEAEGDEEEDDKQDEEEEDEHEEEEQEEESARPRKKRKPNEVGKKKAAGAGAGYRGRKK
ncbi:hypothetical protein M427DRAFT_27776 [Gonapodya prolifera JEL478]|uniref:Uncharacterized protein n=1 Tax=Gonapodya prolifera (strain JEL478) TaxID=1344416 RepID=A0A139AXF9_GONPJ|nr:hypothetical protein M427DRAFT_27776 [Gonapodya prolifera JEL478]|eukprot:KXS21397.1 hypothetical protein M427DRAFT_27776 [Gonapodya prolifera JEL478]